MQLLLTRFIKSAILTLIFVAILLLAAGSWYYWQAWLYLDISLMMNLTNILALKDNSELSEERSKPGKNAEPWDKKILGIGFILNILIFLIAGLDSGRYHFTPEFPWKMALIGVCLNVPGMTIFIRALKETKFFSAIVRIQSERNHQVCTTGPYRLVRHPGYLGMILGTIGFLFLFLSYWSVIPTFLSIVLLIIRTKKEDLFLAKELAGYTDYQKSTKYLLIPNMW